MLIFCECKSIDGNLMAASSVMWLTALILRGIRSTKILFKMTLCHYWRSNFLDNDVRLLSKLQQKNTILAHRFIMM